MSEHERVYAVRVVQLRTYYHVHLVTAYSVEEARAIVQGLIEEEEQNYFDRQPDSYWEYEEHGGYRIDTIRPEDRS